MRMAGTGTVGPDRLRGFFERCHRRVRRHASGRQQERGGGAPCPRLVRRRRPQESRRRRRLHGRRRRDAGPERAGSAGQGRHQGFLVEPARPPRRRRPLGAAEAYTVCHSNRARPRPLRSRRTSSPSRPVRVLLRCLELLTPVRVGVAQVLSRRGCLLHNIKDCFYGGGSKG